MATLARCPVTGQVGQCPSASFGSSSSAADTPCQDLSTREQQANLWQSLLERNGHVSKSSSSAAKECSSSSRASASILKQVGEDVFPSTHSSRSVPRLMHSSSTFTTSGSGSFDSDDDSIDASNTKTTSTTPTVERKWPTYDQVSAHVLMADYHEALTSPVDQHATQSKTTKMLCPHGVVAQVKLELFDQPTTTTSADKPYTGLLTPGTTVEHGLIRLSSALRPVDHGVGGALAKAVARKTLGAKLCASQILPAAALKVFREGAPSGNVLLLGSKVGQASTNFFEHPLCTAVTEKIPSLGIPFLRRFSRYSKYPLSLGLSDLSKYNARGEETQAEEQVFPFALCLQPVVDWSKLYHQQQDNNNNYNHEQEDEPTFDTFIDDITRHVPVGTVLFDIYAAPTPESVGHSHQLQRIGRVVSTSPFIYSSPTDGLTFRHQVKEDDLTLEPTWEDRMHSAKVHTLSDNAQGTVAKMTGWQVFEDHIVEKGDHVDFETLATQKSKPLTAVDDDDDDDTTRKGTLKSMTSAEPSAVEVPGWNFCGFRKASVFIA